MQNPNVLLKQNKYCKLKKVPFFAPVTGICFNCKGDITNHWKTISRAGREHIVSCPFCNWSFCD